MNRRPILLLWLTLLAMVAVPGTSLLAGQPLRYDTSSRSERTFQAGRIAAYKDQKAFNYSVQQPGGTSWWDQVKAWLWMKISDMFRYKAISLTFRALLWILCIGTVLYTVLRIVGMDKVMLFISRRNAGALPYTVGEEDIHAIDFDQDIDEAERTGNYRQAIRLQYLRSLKYLAERDRIHWQANKTNIDYLAELAGSGLEDGFRKITRVFEYAWYGEMDLPREHYRLASEWFVSFQNMVTG